VGGEERGRLWRGRGELSVNTAPLRFKRSTQQLISGASTAEVWVAAVLLIVEVQFGLLVARGKLNGHHRQEE
jgi:hypothetical protein